MQFVMQSIINQFAHVHQTMSVRHMYNVVCHLMNHIQCVQNVKATPIARMIKLVSTKNARIHVHLGEFVPIMLFVMFKLIDHCACVKKDSLEMLNLLVMKLVAVPITIVQQHMLASIAIALMCATKFNVDEVQFVDRITVIMRVAIV